jgi:hypothetical protein
MIEFYNVATRERVRVPESKVRHQMTSNGRHQLMAEMDGMKMFKFISAEEAKKFMK